MPPGFKPFTISYYIKTMSLKFSNKLYNVAVIVCTVLQSECCFMFLLSRQLSKDQEMRCMEQEVSFIAQTCYCDDVFFYLKLSERVKGDSFLTL